MQHAFGSDKAYRCSSDTKSCCTVHHTSGIHEELRKVRLSICDSLPDKAVRLMHCWKVPVFFNAVRLGVQLSMEVRCHNIVIEH